MNNQKATVDVTTPALLIDTRFRVAVPPVVVAGMITTAYVPPLNGVRDPKVSLQAPGLMVL